MAYDDFFNSIRDAMGENYIVSREIVSAGEEAYQVRVERRADGVAYYACTIHHDGLPHVEAANAAIRLIQTAFSNNPAR